MGEIFTVDDNTNHGVIESFEIIDNGMYAKCSSGLFSIKELSVLPTSKEQQVVTNNNDVQVPLSFNEIIKAVGERIMKYDQEQLKKLIAEKLKK